MNPSKRIFKSVYYSKRDPCRMTPKQVQLLKAVQRRAPDGSDYSIMDLAKVFGVKENTMWERVRLLEGHDLLDVYEGHRPGKMVRLSPNGISVLRPATLPSA